MRFGHRAVRWMGMFAAVAALAGFLEWPILANHSHKAVRSAPTATTADVNPDPQFGIEPGWSLTNLSPTDLAARLEGVKQLGATWVRFDMDWAIVQPNNPTSYNWTAYDRVTSAIRAAGLHALGIIDYSPTWAQGSNHIGTQVVPADMQAYGVFAGAVAARYGPQGFHDWEIWNEPNWTTFWQPQPDPGAYATMLKAAYSAIHQRDPRATVIIAGLSASTSQKSSIDAVTYLQDLYAAGAGGWFDAAAMHPYTYPYYASDALHATAWQEMIGMHQVMQAHGDGNKQIWITEYGAPTHGPGTMSASAGGNPPPTDDHVSEALQAQLLTNAVQQYETLPWAGPFLWYDYEDSSFGSRTDQASFGLLRADGTKKPAYAAYQQAILTAPKQ